MQNTETYELCNVTESDLVNQHIEFCKHYNIEVEDICKKLPSLYMMPKFHKSPVGSRYIAASCNSSFKLLAKVLSPILKEVQINFKRKVNYEFKFKNTSHGYWIADNNAKLRKDLEMLSNCDSGKNY